MLRDANADTEKWWQSPTKLALISLIMVIGLNILFW
jgi:hypothetical protein